MNIIIDYLIKTPFGCYVSVSKDEFMFVKRTAKFYGIPYKIEVDKNYCIYFVSLISEN